MQNRILRPNLDKLRCIHWPCNTASIPMSERAHGVFGLVLVYRWTLGGRFARQTDPALLISYGRKIPDLLKQNHILFWWIGVGRSGLSDYARSRKSRSRNTFSPKGNGNLIARMPNLFLVRVPSATVGSLMFQHPSYCLQQPGYCQWPCYRWRPGSS
jgi:hypothetical protein